MYPKLYNLLTEPCELQYLTGSITKLSIIQHNDTNILNRYKVSMKTNILRNKRIFTNVLLIQHFRVLRQLRHLFYIKCKQLKENCAIRMWPSLTMFILHFAVFCRRTTTS